jgi:transposase
MKLHANAKLGLAGRCELVLAIESGMTLKQAADCFSVSPATAHRWWHRWLEGGRSSAALLDRSSRPHRQPRRLSWAEEEPILRARRQTNLGPGRLAGIVRRARSTIWKVLHRHGLSRRQRAERASYRRYEWSRPGALLHMDVKKLARFSVPGHRVTGDRSTKDLHRGIGYDHLHCVVDDHSRIAYVELHPREDAESNAATLERALRFFAELGCQPPEAVMTDNAMATAAQPASLPSSPRPAPATSAHPPTRHAGTAKPNASSAPFKTNGLTPTAGPTHTPAPAAS